MNEFIKVNVDTQTVSARELHEKLSGITDFKEFFIEVSELRVALDADGLRLLRDSICDLRYLKLFGGEAIAYLKDSIITEMTIPCKSPNSEKESEKYMHDQIVNNFTKIFPQYNYVQSERKVDAIGRIDILATDQRGRAVIIELKAGNKNPNTQLISYATKFEEPTLIGITQKPLSDEQKIDSIIYYTLEELKERCGEWIF